MTGPPPVTVTTERAAPGGIDGSGPAGRPAGIPGPMGGTAAPPTGAPTITEPAALTGPPTTTEPAGPTEPTVPTPPGGPRGWRDWLLVAGLCLLTAWVAVVAVFFLPLHVGPVPMPVSVLLPVAVLAWAPRAAHRLTGRLAAAAAVVLAWFAVSVVLVLVRNDLYLRYPVTVAQGQWRVMLLLGLGALTAAATLGLLWGDHLRRTLPGRPDPGGAEPAP